MKKFLFLACFISLSACALNPSVSDNTKTPALPNEELQDGFSRFNDIPVPEKAVMDLKQSLVLGTQDAWIGRLVFSAPYTQNGMFDFYLTEMPKFGWKEITVVRAKTCVLSFSRDNRIATIQLDSDFNGVVVTFTASPKSEKNHK